MPSTFKTNPEKISALLQDCHTGKLQLPDFQRGWVWDIDRIVSLIASISKGYPIGALMSLESGGVVAFHPRSIEGSPTNGSISPQKLILDGQQRITSLYQATMRKSVVDTSTPRGKPIRRWFYFDMRRSIDPDTAREDAIVSLAEDKMIRSDFGRVVDLDLSVRENEFENLYFPINEIFDSMDWLLGYTEYWRTKDADVENAALFRQFNDTIIRNFTDFDVPVITLDKETSKEAVCIVFEKVNTGGKALDAFELITAIYASDGYQLRNDWYGADGEEGMFGRLRESSRSADEKVGILAGVEPTDVLHVISLFHTRDLRHAAEAAGKTGKDLPQVIGSRQALLNLPLEAYLKYKDVAEDGFVRAGKFLYRLHIYRVYDLPYQSQLVPLAAILGSMGDASEHAAKRVMLEHWYWSGVFGELYGSTTETRVAKDFLEVPAWLESNGPDPSTVKDSQFRAARLRTMRMRLSAAYKGVNALLMLENAMDWRTGQQFDHTVFFGESVDIHHIFPQKWCKDHSYPKSVYDSIINKTPLSKKTNRIIGGDAPSKYLKKLMKGNDKDPAIDETTLRTFVSSHFVDYGVLESDEFEIFMQYRQEELAQLIEKATGKSVVRETEVEDDLELEGDADEDE